MGGPNFEVCPFLPHSPRGGNVDKNKHEVNGKTGLITDSKHVCGDTNNIT